MTPSSKIFCNTPWYELHIYWDGSLGICCQEDHKLYSDEENYNIATTSINDWFNSDPVKKFRQQLLANKRSSLCVKCYNEEDHGGVSRRLRSNQKSVIFTQAFDQSIQQSPGWSKFQFSHAHQGATVTHPIDLHIDLGNHCNLACKMCWAKASSTIASQNVKWGIEQDRIYLGQNWTQNEQVWNNFKRQLLEIPGLNNIHFMGGETLLTSKMEDLVDTFIEQKRFDVCFSFVTNGTVYKPHLIEKLKLFRRTGIEISIECLSDKNSYTRQGTDTDKVLENIKKYQSFCDNSSVTLSLRPTPSLLTVGSYVGLLQYAVDNQLIIKSSLCQRPRFLNIEILPRHIKSLYKADFEKFIADLNCQPASKDYNASDPNNIRLIALHEAEMCVNALSTPTPVDSEQQLEIMVRHCEKWDRVYHLNAKKTYPELESIFECYDYQV